MSKLVTVVFPKEQFEYILQGSPIFPFSEELPDQSEVIIKEEGSDRSITVTLRCPVDFSLFVPGLYLYVYHKKHLYMDDIEGCTCGCFKAAHCNDPNCPHCSAKNILKSAVKKAVKQLLDENGLPEDLVETIKRMEIPGVVMGVATGRGVEELKKEIQSTVPFEVPGLEEATTVEEVMEALKTDGRVVVTGMTASCDDENCECHEQSEVPVRKGTLQ